MVLAPREYLGSLAPLVRKEDKAPHHKGFDMDAELMSTFVYLVWECHLPGKGIVHLHIQMPNLCMQSQQLESNPTWKSCFSFCCIYSTSLKAHLNIKF